MSIRMDLPMRLFLPPRFCMNADIVYVTLVLASADPTVYESSVPLVSVSVMCGSCKGLKTGPTLEQTKFSSSSTSPYLWMVKVIAVSSVVPGATVMLPSTRIGWPGS